MERDLHAQAKEHQKKCDEQMAREREAMAAEIAGVRSDWEGELASCRKALRYVDVRKGGYRGVVERGLAGRALADQLTKLADQYLGLEAAVEKADAQIGATSSTLDSLRTQLAAAQDLHKQRVQQLAQSAREERSTLVHAALGSLTQARYRRPNARPLPVRSL
jgi:hypothetical protein